jgi:hypothetical protein
LTPYNVTQVTLLNTGTPNPIGRVNGVSIDKSDLDVCKKMTRAAVDAEDSFNTEITVSRQLKLVNWLPESSLLSGF